MKKYLKSLFAIILIVTAIGAAACGKSNSSGSNRIASNASGEKDRPTEVVKIGIGYQTVTAQTWGSLIMKNQKFLEQELKAAYPEQEFEVSWENATSGPPLTNNMVAGKLQFSFMGDLPILVNGEKGETEKNYDSVFLAFDGKGDGGANQAVLVTKGGEITSVEDLAGKEVSIPIGSSAHRMLELALEKYGIFDQVTIVSQDVNVGLTNIEQGKIAAHATWEPFPTLAVTTGSGIVLIDGAETGVDYLDGVVADRTWVQEHEGYTVAFLKALVKSHEFILENPEEAAKIFAEESGYDETVTTEMVKNIHFESVIYDKDIETMKGDLDFAISVGNVKSLDLEKFVDDSYLKMAYEELGIEYEGN